MDTDKNAKIPSPCWRKFKPLSRLNTDSGCLHADAIERRLCKQAWKDLLDFGEGHARARGLAEADVEEAIAEARRENTEYRL